MLIIADPCPPPPIFDILFRIIGFWKQNRKLRKSACTIAILGSKGAGKTTLWQQLSNRYKGKDEVRPTLYTEDTDEFIINYNGELRRVLKSKDYNGDDNAVSSYKDVIQKGTFIFYLIDLTTLEENKEETAARLQKIIIDCEMKNLKIFEDVGLHLVATHYNEWKEKNQGKCEQDAKQELLSHIDFDDINGLNKIKNSKKFLDLIIVAELSDNIYIENFYELIILNK